MDANFKLYAESMANDKSAANTFEMTLSNGVKISGPAAVLPFLFYEPQTGGEVERRLIDAPVSVVMPSVMVTHSKFTAVIPQEQLN